MNINIHCAALCSSTPHQHSASALRISTPHQHSASALHISTAQCINALQEASMISLRGCTDVAGSSRGLGVERSCILSPYTFYTHQLSRGLTFRNLDHNTTGIPESARGSFTALEDDNRVTCSSGEVICEDMKHETKSYLGQASVLSMFVSLLHIDKLPMVQRDPCKCPVDCGSNMYVCVCVCVYVCMCIYVFVWSLNPHSTLRTPHSTLNTQLRLDEAIPAHRAIPLVTPFNLLRLQQCEVQREEETQPPSERRGARIA